MGQGQEMRKNERKAKKQDIETLEILKTARGRNAKQVLKCFKNGHTGRRAGQGDKSIGLGSRNAKKRT